MYAHYLQVSSHNLTELCNLSFMEKAFYIASMIVIKKRENQDRVSLAKYSNPFLKVKK